MLLEESKKLHISLLLVFDDDDNYDDAQEQRETGITHQIKEERERERESGLISQFRCVFGFVGIDFDYDYS